MLRIMDSHRETSVARTLRAIETAALGLSREERAQLVQTLLASLVTEERIEAVWNAEIERRVADLEAGRVATIPSEEVFAEARRLLRT